VCASAVAKTRVEPGYEAAQHLKYKDMIEKQFFHFKCWVSSHFNGKHFLHVFSAGELHIVLSASLAHTFLCLFG